MCKIKAHGVDVLTTMRNSSLLSCDDYPLVDPVIIMVSKVDYSILLFHKVKHILE